MPSKMRLTLCEYEALVDQAPCMIRRWGRDAKCDFFNEAWLAFTGRALDQELGDGWADGVFPDDLQNRLQSFQDAFRRREPFETQYRLRRHDGLYRRVLERAAPYADERGEFAGYIGSCMDVAARVEAPEGSARPQARQPGEPLGFLAVCAHCRKVANPAGGWEPFEVYLRSQGRIGISHGLCPDCFGSGFLSSVAPAALEAKLKGRLLVVDDQPAIIAALQRYFSQKGYDVRGVMSAEEALAAARRDPFDVILLDNVLPGANGMDSIAELGVRARVVMISGQCDEELKREAVSLGAADFFAKPLDFEALSRCVESLIVRSGSARGPS